MFVLSKFIGDCVTHRPSSVFGGNIQTNSAKLSRIPGAGFGEVKICRFFEIM